jgi:hypothetical protein
MCFIDKTQENLAIILGFEIKCDVAFVAIDEFPPQAFTVTGVAPRHASQRISSIRSLDLDDVCSEVG